MTEKSSDKQTLLSIWASSPLRKSISAHLRRAWRWIINEETLEEMRNADDVTIGTHVFLVLLCGFCCLFLLWACFFHLDIVSTAQGEVVPSTKLKRVQHLEGGIIQEIKVHEGEAVRKNQPLVYLESTASFSDVQQLELQIASLTADVARLQAEAKGDDRITFPKELIEKRPELIAEAEKVFKTRLQRFESEKHSQADQVAQREAELKEVTARLSRSKEELKLTQEQVDISEKLLKEDLTNRYNHIDLLRSLNSLKSRIEEDTAATKRLESALSEEKSDLAGVEDKFKEEVAKQLEESTRQLKELTKKMEKYADSLQRTTLTSPVDGVVKQLYFSAKGEVVKPGETVLDILPSGDKLIVDAKLPIKDIGYVEVGQSAMIRLSSADARQFGHLDGKVIFVSPDSIQDEKEDPYYRVRIETDKDYFQSGALKYRLYPGVQVVANIRTGKRTVMSYLLDPFFGSLKEAMTER